jgi:hypothetical protein
MLNLLTSSGGMERTYSGEYFRNSKSETLRFRERGLNFLKTHQKSFSLFTLNLKMEADPIYEIL